MKNLILLHGSLGHPDQFKAISTELEKEFKVHILLFKGHGIESASEQDFFAEDLVHQLHQFIEKNKIENPSVFGYSLGGYIALFHSLRYPGVIKSILTLATKLEWSPEIAEKEIQLLDPGKIMQKVPKFAAHLQSVHGDSWKQLLGHIAELMKDIGKNNYLNETTLAKINIPVQIMVGDSDKQVSFKESKWAFNHLPNSRFAVLPNTGHPFETADCHLVKSLIYSFLKDK